jgi:hypothetical protein
MRRPFLGNIEGFGSDFLTPFARPIQATLVEVLEK